MAGTHNAEWNFSQPVKWSWYLTCEKQPNQCYTVSAENKKKNKSQKNFQPTKGAIT